MKIASATLRTFTTLHTWVGLVAGFALFVAFYAGAITVFHHELQVWQSPHAVDRPQESLADAQRLLDDVLARHPEARTHVGMLAFAHDHESGGADQLVPHLPVHDVPLSSMQPFMTSEASPTTWSPGVVEGNRLHGTLPVRRGPLDPADGTVAGGLHQWTAAMQTIS